MDMFKDSTALGLSAGVWVYVRVGVCARGCMCAWVYVRVGECARG
jgi:hypothetical protein